MKGKRTAPGQGATAIVVTHNSRRHVEHCLTALHAAGIAVRVVDNASRDGTPALVTARFPDARVLVNKTNLGFAVAVNQALRGIDTDVVLLVNPDCVVPPATVAALVATIRVHPGVGVAGPRLLDSAGVPAVSAHPFETLTSVLASRFGGSLVPIAVRRVTCGKARRVAYDVCRTPGTRPQPVDWLSGACLAVRTTLLADLGGLDEGYFLYYEDEELCWQAWRRNAQVWYLPAVHATHVGGASCADPEVLWPHLYHSLLRFFRRHRPRSYAAVRAAVLLRAVLGVALAGVRWPTARQAARSRAMAWAHVIALAVSSRPGATRGMGLRRR